MLVVFNSRIYTAGDVTKVHTYMLDAFDSPGLGPLGVLDDGRVLFRRSLPGEREALTPKNRATPVDIVYAYAGANGRLLDALRAEGRGVVVAALGRGNTPIAMYEAIKRWIADGKPVVITSRAARGPVGPTYGFPGGGRSLYEAGAIFAGARRPAQARIDLMLALGAGLKGDQLIAAFSH